MPITREWPGRTDNKCPQCGAQDNAPWDMEYKSIDITPFGVMPVKNQPLLSMTCPQCHTRFTTSEA